VSPDGGTVAYCYARVKTTDILSLEIPSDRGKTLVTGLHGNAGEPAYLPDGRSLVLASDAGGDRGQISRIVLATGKATPVLKSQWSDTGPTVGPDGDTLTFVRSTRRRDRSMGGTTWCDADLWIGSMTKENWRRLTHMRGGSASPAQFSPDGTTLYVAFHSITESDIYAVDVATGSTTRVTTTGGYTSDPAVSPDGSVAAVANRPALPHEEEDCNECVSP